MYLPHILTAPLMTTGPMTSEWAFVNDGELQIGVWECLPGALDEPTGDYDEAMFMVAGRATIDHEGGSYDLAPGTLWATPRRWPGAWHVHQAVRKMYVIDHRGGGPAAPSHLPNAYSLDLGRATRRAHVIAGDPHERAVSIWVQNHLDVGVWECTPGEFPFRRDGYDEVFTVLAGHATLHCDSGQSFELLPGAVILTPAGLTGRWVVHETIRKAYTIINDRG